ncbi:MAG: hypothetical protein WC340_02250 [Kiritimatiellia bacterium]
MEKRGDAEDFVEFQRSKGKEVALDDYPRSTWDQLNSERILPEMRTLDGSRIVAPYLTRRDGLQRSFPNLCLKVPTGGGKTLLAAAALERSQADCFKRQSGFTYGWCRQMRSIGRRGGIWQTANTLTVRFWSGHQAGFNPRFVLELSATPNPNGKHQSNVLVNVPGGDLKEEEMIKLPINVVNIDSATFLPFFRKPRRTPP